MLNLKAVNKLGAMFSGRLTFHSKTNTVELLFNEEKKIQGIYGGGYDLTLYDFEGNDYTGLVDTAIKQTDEESNGDEKSEEYQITLISNVLDLLNDADEKDAAGFALGESESDSSEDDKLIKKYFCISDAYQTREVAEKDPFFAQLMKKANPEYRVHFKTFGTKFKKPATFKGPTINCKVLQNKTPGGIKQMTGADVGIQNRVRTAATFEGLMEASVKVIEKECQKWIKNRIKGVPVIGIFCSAGKHRCRAITYYLKGYCYPKATITHLMK